MEWRFRKSNVVKLHYMNFKEKISLWLKSPKKGAKSQPWALSTYLNRSCPGLWFCTCFLEIWAKGKNLLRSSHLYVLCLNSRKITSPFGITLSFELSWWDVIFFSKRVLPTATVFIQSVVYKPHFRTRILLFGPIGHLSKIFTIQGCQLDIYTPLHVLHSNAPPPRYFYLSNKRLGYNKRVG